LTHSASERLISVPLRRRVHLPAVALAEEHAVSGGQIERAARLRLRY